MAPPADSSRSDRSDLPLWQRPWLPALALFLLSLGLYARTLGYEFLNWDDGAYVLENPWIREISFSNLVSIFTQPVLSSFFPLQSVSYMLDYQLWEFDPFGYHLTSLVLNGVVVVLVFQVLLLLSRRPAIALVAALLFAVHHSHVSSVSWVSGRKDLLSAAFFLLALGVYLRARRDAAFHWPLYGLSVLLFGLGAAGKASISTYPAFFLLADWILDSRLPVERRRSFGFHLATKLPLVAAALPFVWMNSLVQATSTSAWAADPLAYAFVKGQASWRYTWVLLGLSRGQPIYDLPPISLHPAMIGAALLPLAISSLLFLFALRRRHDDAALSLAWLVIGLAPPILFPVIHFMADRYLYVPSLGFCWLLATGIVTLSERRRPPAQFVVIGVLSFAAMGWFAGRTWDYTPAWRDSIAFWSYAKAFSRDGRVAVGLSSALLDAERLEEAEQVLLETEVPGLKGELNLAIVYFRQDRHRAGLAASLRARALLETQGGAEQTAFLLHRVHGLLLWQLHRRDEAIASWQDALRLRPGDPGVLDLLWRARQRSD